MFPVHRLAGVPIRDSGIVLGDRQEISLGQGAAVHRRRPTGVAFLGAKLLLPMGRGKMRQISRSLGGSLDRFRGFGIVACAPAFQAGDAGSIPAIRSNFRGSVRAKTAVVFGNRLLEAVKLPAMRVRFPSTLSVSPFSLCGRTRRKSVVF